MCWASFWNELAGTTLGETLRKRIFQPLEMIDTGFTFASSQANRLARPLAVDPIAKLPQAMRDRTQPFANDCGTGCAVSMYSTVFRPRIRVWPSTSYPNLNGYGFGLGVAVRRGSGVSGMMGSPGDYNWGGGYGTYFWVDPKEQLAVVCMAAAPGAARIRVRQLITTLTLQAIEK